MCHGDGSLDTERHGKSKQNQIGPGVREETLIK